MTQIPRRAAFRVREGDATATATIPRVALVPARAGAQVAAAELQRRRVEEERSALLEIAWDISGALDLDEILERVQRRTAAAVPCDRVLTYRWDPDRQLFFLLAEHGSPEDLRAQVRLEFHASEAIVDTIRAGEAVVVNDAAKPGGGVAPEILDRLRIAAMAAVPLLVHGRVSGALVAVIDRRRGGRFRPPQVHLLESVARQLALGIEAADLYRKQREEAEVSQALARAGQELIASFDAPSLPSRLCGLVTAELECDSSHTVLWSPEEEAFRPIAGRGDPPETWELIRLPKLPREAMAGFFARLEGDGITQVDVHESASPLAAAARQLGIDAMLCMVLRRGEEMIGFQTACLRGRRARFTAWHERIARGIAQLASLALEHARVAGELERANRLKSEFVSTMSHELRTPLHVILGYTDLVLDGAFGELGAEQVDVLRRVDASARQLQDLISDTLNLGRLEAGRLPLDLRDVDLLEVIEEVHAHALHLPRKPGVEIERELAADLPRLHTDPGKLKVVLKNLVGNALKFTEQGGVRVGARGLGDGVELHVADTGIGIPPAERAIIFEPFRQADAAVQRQTGGVGLGLYIVRRMVEILGGSVTLESEVGRGSTFRVRLPIDPGAPGAQAQTAAE